jgi:hypothetical protein
MTYLFKNLLLIVCIIISSCGQDRPKTYEERREARYEKQKQLDSLNLIESQKLSKVSNSIIDWDTADYYTVTLQDIFDTTSRPISFIGEIKDIIRVDSIFILKVISSNPKNYADYIADIYVDDKIYQEVKSKISIKGDNEGCFIFQVEKITSHHPVLKSEIEPDGYDVENASSDIIINFDKRLIKFHGRLVDYFIYTQVKQEDLY